MFFGGGLLGIIFLSLWVYCIVDVVATDDSSVRNLPKLMWLLLVILLPLIGSLTWLGFGRPQGAGFAPGDSSTRPPGPVRKPPRRRGPLGPEDSSDFMASLDERLREERKKDQGDGRA
jgi:hypothetical protein